MPRRVPVRALGRLLRPGRAAAIAMLVALPAVGFAVPAYAAGSATVTISGLAASMGAEADPTGFTVAVDPGSETPTEVDLTVSDPAGIDGVTVFGPDGQALSGSNGTFVYPTSDFSSAIAFSIRTTTMLHIGSALTISADVTDGSGTSLSTGADSATTELQAPTVTLGTPMPADPTIDDTVTTNVTITNNTGSSYTGDNAFYLGFTFATPRTVHEDDISMSDGTTTTHPEINEPGSFSGVFPDRNGPGLYLADGDSHDLTLTFTHLWSGVYHTYVGGSDHGWATTSSFDVAGRPVVDAHVPSTLGAWADPTEYAVDTTNIDPTSCPSPYLHVRLTGDQALHAADVKLKFDYDENGGWQQVALSEDNGDLEGSTRPGSIWRPEQLRSFFRIVVNAPFDENADDIALALSRLAITTSVESGGAVCGSGTDTNNVKLRLPTLTFNLPDKIHAGATTPFTVTIRNNTGSSYSKLTDLSLTMLDKDDINPGDITISTAGGNSHRLPCDAEGLLICDLTNGHNFTLANGQVIAQHLQMTVADRVRNQELLTLAELDQNTADGQGLAMYVDYGAIVGSAAQSRPAPGGSSGGSGGSGGSGSGSGSGGTLAMTGAPTLVPTVLTGLLLLATGGGLLAFGAAGRRRRETEVEPI